MTKARKQSRTTPLTVPPRGVYACLVSGNTVTIEAATTSDLAKRLTPLLGLEPYSVQAIARIAHLERATITTPTWSIRRLGTLQFAPDDDVAPSSSKAADRHNTEVPTLTTLQGGVSSLPDWMRDGDAES